MSERDPHYLERELYERVRQDPAIFDFLQAGSLDGLWYWDLEKPEHEWMNARFWEVLGYDPAKRQHLAAEWQDLINPDDLKTAIENFKQHCADPEHPYDQIVRYRHRDGSTVWIRCRGIVIRDAEDKPVRMLGAHTDVTELKQNELRLREAEQKSTAAAAALRESEERYRALYDDAPVLHVNVDPQDGRIKDCNRLTVSRLGYVDKQEIVGRPIFDLYHEDCLDEVREAFHRFATIGRVENAELQLKCQDGSAVPVILNVASVKDEEGNILYSSSTWVEISDLKQAQIDLDTERERQQAESDRQRRAALNLAQDAERARCRAEDAEHRLEMVASQLALPPREFVAQEGGYHLDGFSLRDMISCGAELRSLSRQHDSVDGIANAIAVFFHQRFPGGEEESEFALVRLFRTERFGALSAKQKEFARTIAPDAEDDARCLVLAGTAGDRDEWRTVEKSSEVQAVPLDATAAPERLPLVTDLLRSLGLNVGQSDEPKAELMLGNVSGRTIHLADAVDNPHLPDQRGFVGPHGIRSVIGVGDRLPGDGAFVLIAFARAEIGEDVARLFSHLSHSIKLALLPHLKTDRRTVEQILAFDRLLANHEEIVGSQEAKLHEAMEALARSNEELDQFAHVASHDLKAPLRAIDNLAKWIEEDNTEVLPESAREDLATMRGRVNRMESLLESLLAYSRIGRVEDDPSVVDVSRLLEDVIGLQDVPDGFAIKVGAGMPTLHAARGALLRVFGNLISNALKHRERDDGVIDVTCREAGRHYEFRVRDDGPGIDPQFHGRIFDMFQTLKPRDEQEGSGMGLAIVKKTIERHGGGIRVESEPGEGTEFIFTWPTAPGAIA